MDLQNVIRELEQRLLNPEVRASAADLGQLLAHDFVEFGSSGRTFTKASIIAALEAKPTPSANVMEDFRVQELAHNVALATYRCGGSLRSSVWRCEGNEWKMVFHQGTMGEPAERVAVATDLTSSAELSEVAGPLISIELMGAASLGLIVSCGSGVTYTNRIQGDSGATLSAEGAFATIGTEDQCVAISRIFDQEERATVGARDADLIDEVLSQHHTTKILTVDRGRLDESRAGWIFVLIGNHPDRFPTPPFIANRETCADPESPVRQASSPIFGFGAARGILTWPAGDTISTDELISRSRPVPEVDRSSLRLSGPRSGWLWVELELGDYRLDLQASLVMNDPLRELFDLLSCGELSFQSFRRVCLWREPEGYAIDVQALSEESFMITLRFDKNFHPPMAGHSMMQRFRCIVRRDVFSRAVSRGLTEWFASAADVELSDADRALYRSRLAEVGLIDPTSSPGGAPSGSVV